MEEYAAEIEGKMQRFFGWLSENDRRRYAAVEATKLGHGGVEYIAKILGIDSKTIRRGQHELDNLPAQPPTRVREPGGGRRRKIDDDPKLDDDFCKTLATHTAGSPTEESTIWTNL